MSQYVQGLIEKHRLALEAERGEPFLTVKEAADRLGITTTAIYASRAKYDVHEHGGSCFVPLRVVDPPAEPIPIRGVEYKEHIGRVNVTRYLCLQHREYFRTLEVAMTHPCFAKGRGGQNR